VNVQHYLKLSMKKNVKTASCAYQGNRQAYAGQIGPGPASPIGALVGQKSPVEERIKRTLAARRDELVLEQALLRLEEKSAAAANAELQAKGQIAALTAKSVNAAKYAARQTTGPLALPAFTERGLQVLDNSLKLNESSLRIEQALNGERARGVRFLEKQSAEEATSSRAWNRRAKV
jgi:predicted amino acid dehydrogenase